ncbi:MAG TPA: hypothetical protein VE777_01405 [Gaiellales bacterium]|nr:hypothetical protein [Gaiellales bacterium]
MNYLPTLYKQRRVPTKQAVCAICVERTRGRTTLVTYGYGVSVWLCQAHASHEFQTQRSGRDLVLTLQRLWHAHGCLTAARRQALRAHLDACSGAAARPRPGSYSWPDLRREAEGHFAAGAAPGAVIDELRRRHADCPARPPSVRTMRRWHAERRWLARGP